MCRGWTRHPILCPKSGDLPVWHGLRLRGGFINCSSRCSWIVCNDCCHVSNHAIARSLWFSTQWHLRLKTNLLPTMSLVKKQSHHTPNFLLLPPHGRIACPHTKFPGIPDSSCSVWTNQVQQDRVGTILMDAKILSIPKNTTDHHSWQPWAKIFSCILKATTNHHAWQLLEL